MSTITWHGREDLNGSEVERVESAKFDILWSSRHPSRCTQELVKFATVQHRGRTISLYFPGGPSEFIYTRIDGTTYGFLAGSGCILPDLADYTEEDLRRIFREGTASNKAAAH
jgi:hypothetical protein